MGAKDNAQDRTRPMAAETMLRRRNRYAYIRQLYIDELRYDSGQMEDEKFPDGTLKDVKHKIRNKLKREARMRFFYASLVTVVVVGLLAVVLVYLIV